MVVSKNRGMSESHRQEMNSKSVSPLVSQSHFIREKPDRRNDAKYLNCKIQFFWGASTSGGILLSMKQVQRILWGSPESPPLLMEWTWDESSWTVKRVGDPISGRKGTESCLRGVDWQEMLVHRMLKARKSHRNILNNGVHHNKIFTLNQFDSL